MQVFVYEYLCANPLPTSAGASLQAEGWRMLHAVLADLACCPGVTPVTLLARSFTNPPLPPSVRIHRPPPDQQEQTFRALARNSSFSLVIAPEFDDLLHRHCRRVIEEGGSLLGPGPDAVQLTADKWVLSKHLHEVGIPTPRTVVLESPEDALRTPFPLVCKPRTGAGSQATFLVQEQAGLQEAIRQARQEGWEGELVVQPFIQGMPVSVACLHGRGGTLLLPAVTQEFSADGRFHYLGGTLPLLPQHQQRAHRLARNTLANLPGLWGYLGMDMILGKAMDGSEDHLIEINPRMTTSYIGLRQHAQFNLMEVLLALVQGQPGPVPTWQEGSVSFGVEDRAG